MIIRNGINFLAWWTITLSCVPSIEAFYLPGWSIQTYMQHDNIPLYVNKIRSDQSPLTYAYYDLPFVCQPTGESHGSASLTSSGGPTLNLGEVLRGDRITTSDYEINMLEQQDCHFLCNQTINRQDMKWAKQLIHDGYMVEWIVDNLPGATSYVTHDKSSRYYGAGFKLGYQDLDVASGRSSYFINNHANIVLKWRKMDGKPGTRGEKVIIAFEVYTKSIGETVRQGKGCPADVHADGSGLELYIPPSSEVIQKRAAEREAGISFAPADLDLQDVDDGQTLTIPFSYSVYFKEDDRIPWSNRWDLYFVNQEDSTNIRWLAVANSLVIAGLLFGMVAVILTRTIKGDTMSKESPLEKGKRRHMRRKSSARTPRSEKQSEGLLAQGDDDVTDINLLSDEDEMLEDITGWKLLHGDVFRPPAYGGLLAPLVGSGMQLVLMSLGLVILSSLGVLNPSWRGGFVSTGIGLFIIAGVFSGYFSARLYKTFGGEDWRRNCAVTALLFPGLLFITIFILNLFVWAQASSTALPFGTLLVLLALWLLVQVPLVYAGSWIGFVRSSAWQHPVKTNAIPRQMPRLSWYNQTIQSALLAGLIPFGVIFIELLFVFKSLWQDKSGYYYMFGFLALISILLVITIVELTIVVTYVQLCSENHHWWWQSFLVGGGSSFWVFMYILWFYFTKLHLAGPVSTMLFFSYSFLACLVYGLLTGTVGFLTAYAFVGRIYGGIKAD